MSEVRPLEAPDLPRVATLFQQILLHDSTPAPASLRDYMGALFLDTPGNAGAGSQVYVREGEVAGFIGGTTLPMLVDGKEVRAAIASSLMVEANTSDPMAGARLIRAFLAGPQDISLSDTASATAAGMWRTVGATILPAYSYDWLKVMRPSRYAVARLGMFSRLLSPVAAGMDALLRATGRGGRFWRGPDAAQKTASISERDIDRQEAAELITKLVAKYRLRPAWSVQSLEHVLSHAADKSELGPLQARAVARGKATIGVYLYHGRTNGIGRVLHVLAEPGRMSLVVDRMLAHAAEGGLAALGGRANPELLEALIGKDVVLSNTASTAIASKSLDLVEPAVLESALITGLAGESWTRLIGHKFN